MSCSSRHEEILECIRDLIVANTNDPYLASEITIEDMGEEDEPPFGISVSPVGEEEQVGTNERDDIDYITQVVRTVHSLGSDDRKAKSEFRVNMRTTFHNKRIQCSGGCYGYSRIEFGNFAIPSAWKSENKSVSVVRIRTLVREPRSC